MNVQCPKCGSTRFGPTQRKFRNWFRQCLNEECGYYEYAWKFKIREPEETKENENE